MDTFYQINCVCIETVKENIKEEDKIWKNRF